MLYIIIIILITVLIILWDKNSQFKKLLEENKKLRQELKQLKAKEDSEEILQEANVQNK